VHCPLGSLPRALATEPATIPAAVPYLGPDKDRVAKWRAPPRGRALAAHRHRLVRKRRSPNDRNRSIALEQLAPTPVSDNASFLSIQRELRGEDAALMAASAAYPRRRRTRGFRRHRRRGVAGRSGHRGGYVGGHLAGALGRPTWVLVPFAPDWRWMLDREDSPGTDARLFRQGAPATGRA